MAPKQEKNVIQKFLDNLKIGYFSGQNAIARAHTAHGFLTSKNAALNLGRLMGVPYDNELRIRPNDPAQQLRQVTSGIGRIERIHNTYLKPRVKLAD